MTAGPLEITDLLWPVDADGARLPALRAGVLGQLAGRGQHRAARIVARMPAAGGLLDPGYLDTLAVRVHCELQRLSEELQLGRRIAALLGPLTAGLRREAPGAPVRVVDVGCGLGYVVRSMAAVSALGPGVELVGVDVNPVLAAEAARLARLEGLDCRFTCGDALKPGGAVADPARTVIISSGLLHHLPAAGLPEFFAAQGRLGVAAFAHWDIAPCLWSTLGAWVFHQARMREAVSRHDGVLSARRAHPAAVLRAAAQAGAPGYQVRVLEGPRWRPRALDVLRPVVGTRA
ncbi:MAG: methyltransferase domain-containing protein [Gemmatimonadota bacterium]